MLARTSNSRYRRSVNELVQNVEHHPCVFSMVERGLHYLHHGDDFAIVGTHSEVKWISEQMGQTFIVKDRGTLGPRHWDKKVMTILHRVLRWVPHSDNGPERIEYEADPRHREVLSLQLGLADGETRSVTSPFEKIKITPDTERELQESEATVFRSAVMRLVFWPWTVQTFNSERKKRQEAWRDQL